VSQDMGLCKHDPISKMESGMNLSLIEKSKSGNPTSFHERRGRFAEDIFHASELFMLPDFKISFPPLISTSLHKLAEVGWSLHIRQRVPVSPGVSRPKIRLYPPGQGGWNRGLSFKLKSGPLYTSPEELFKRVHHGELMMFEQPIICFGIKETKVVEQVLASEDNELEILRKINEERSARLKKTYGAPLRKISAHAEYNLRARSP
jgi:hypothetical protein